jgi:hypothetical protein
MFQKLKKKYFTYGINATHEDLDQDEQSVLPGQLCVGHQ